MAGRLQGKIAFISGTGGGQGRSAAIFFAKEGAKIVGCDLKVEGSKETIKMVEAAGGEMISLHPLDLGDGNQVKKWLDFGMKAYGKMNILYNNAAVSAFAPIELMTEEQWRFTIHNELDTVFLACHYAWPYLKASGNGVIINVGSISGVVGHPPEVLPSFAHAATKGGVIALTKQLAIEGAPFNIRANCISPGPIISPATEGQMKNPAFVEGWKRLLPLKRLGLPDEIAHLAVYLASDESSFMTGSNIMIDGGLTAI
jgi:meso-butanediol dehydrogenase/(S,S)-butanediol dehydrogenase/diacetyl reductase